MIVEADRIYHRYMVEFVEGFRLCPWAEKARREGRTRRIVLLSSAPEADPALRALDELGADASVEVGFLIFPCLEMGRLEFERFVASVRKANADRAAVGGPPMALAAFHPDAAPDIAAPHRLIPFLRRSPDPTIQVVRRSVLDAIRGPGDHGTAFVDATKVDLTEFLTLKRRPPLHERVAAMNLATVTEEGVERVEALLDELRADREESYRRVAARFL